MVIGSAKRCIVVVVGLTPDVDAQGGELLLEVAAFGGEAGGAGLGDV